LRDAENMVQWVKQLNTNSWLLIFSESSYLRRHNQLSKIVHQQIAIKYKLLDRNTLPYYRLKLELVLETANMISCWDRSMVTDKMIDLNRPDIVLDRK